MLELIDFDRALSEALIQVMSEAYEKLPDMLRVDSYMPPELIIARLAEFFNSNPGIVFGEVFVSLIINRVLKRVGPLSEERLERLLWGLYL